MNLKPSSFVIFKTPEKRRQIRPEMNKNNRKLSISVSLGVFFWKIQIIHDFGINDFHFDCSAFNHSVEQILCTFTEFKIIHGEKISPRLCHLGKNLHGMNRLIVVLVHLVSHFNCVNNVTTRIMYQITNLQISVFEKLECFLIQNQNLASFNSRISAAVIEYHNRKGFHFNLPKEVNKSLSNKKSHADFIRMALLRFSNGVPRPINNDVLHHMVISLNSSSLMISQEMAFALSNFVTLIKSFT